MRKLAKTADIAYNTLRMMYRDPYRTVTSDTLDKLATALNVDVSLLIESDPPLPKTLEQINGSAP